ncbi:transketolase [Candidatus Dependentiae bacterium]|nr:transketolase [Candidatus Dependentiae bacterium]
MENKISKEKIDFLKKIALNLRIDSIKSTSASKSGHPTTCMAIADLISAIFFHFLKYDIKNPNNPDNDRFILSIGHAIPVVYSAWKNLGVITEQELLDLRKFDSVLEGHPTPRFRYNEAATGSLGQGLAIGVGMALNAKHDNLNYKTYVMIGDGEAAEGSIWEAAQLASYYNLDNLICILDANRLGQSGESIHGHDVEKFEKKFDAFGFKTFCINGHNFDEILNTLNEAQEIKGSPIAIIAKTLKGSGLEDIENENGHHGKPFKQEEVPNLIEKLKKGFGINNLSFEKYTPELPKQLNAGSNNLENKEVVSIDLNSDENKNLFDKDQKIATRKAFGYALKALGQNSKNIFTLDADVQNSTFTQIFAKSFPKRFYQCFIAEQCMVGVATGLQLRGKIPFAATFGAFFTRAHDQIRMAGIGRNSLRLCGSHCGVSIGEDGPSQMALEDLGLFRAIPDSIVFYPSDGVSTYKLTQLMADYSDGISYMRTTRPATQNLYDKNEKFEIGGCKILRQSDNDKVCIIAAGITLHEALKAYNKLLEKNIKVSVIDLYSVKPIDKNTIIDVAKKSGNRIITVEDHYMQGGIGEAISGELSDKDIFIEKLAVNKLPRSGKPEELLRYEGIDSESIVKKVLSF